MANFFQSVRQGFGGGRNNRGNVNGNQQRGNAQTNQAITHNPAVTGLNTQAYASNISDHGLNEAQPPPETPKHFFQEKYARLGVKGNFMPLAAQPKHADLGDWLAHQAVEQYKLLDQCLLCIMEVDTKNTGLPICNSKSCPTMSAGRSHTYTWLNNHKEPVKVPAIQYISLVQRWIVGKLSDNKVFPTDPLIVTAANYASGGVNTPGANTPIPMGPSTSNMPLDALSGRDWVGKSTGFPENFLTDCKTIFRQMFRVYAHMYHSHWVDPFWHIRSENPPSQGWLDLNSCFVHFITVAKLFGLLSAKDMEPMQPLIDIWTANGSIPHEAAVGACAIVPHQHQHQ